MKGDTHLGRSPRCEIDAGKYQGEERGNDDWGERAADDERGHKLNVSTPALERAAVRDDDVNDNYRYADMNLDAKTDIMDF